MLECVIKQDHVKFLEFLHQVCDPAFPVLIYRDFYIVEFPNKLKWFISNVVDVRLPGTDNKALGVAAVTPAKGCNKRGGRKQTDQVFDVRGLAGTSHRKVPNRYDCFVEPGGWQYPQVILQIFE